MSLHEIGLDCASEEEALRQAAAQMQLDPAQLRVSPRPGGGFLARPLDADARVRIEVAPDRMSAHIAEYAPALGQGAPLGVEYLIHYLEEAGVVAGFDHDGIAEAIMGSQSGGDLAGIVLARGEPAKEGKPARVEYAGDPACPVFPGQVLGRLLPAEPAAMGYSVLGDDLAPARGATSRPEAALEPGPGLRLNETGELVCETPGLIVLREGRLALEPLLKVSADGMEVRALVHCRDFKGQPVTVERLTALLLDAQVVAEPDGPVLREALERATREGRAQRVVIARGVPALQGKDGRLDLVSSGQLTAGLERESGCVDFRERGLICAVKAGELVARVIAATKGVPGRDVYGRSISVSDGVPLELLVGEGVERVGKDELRATQDGMMVANGPNIAVSEICEIDGDINYATGNVHMSQGSVVVRGNVQSGFVVEAGGNIVVEGIVEGAVLRAGGDVVVKGGLALQQTGSVHAGGFISARFASNGLLEAEGDVILANELSNCQVRAGGALRLTSGKGTIMGGEIESSSGVFAGEIGSHVGVLSSLRVGHEPAPDQALLAERRVLKERLAKVEGSVGCAGLRETLEQTPPAKRLVMSKLLQVREETRRKLAEAEQALAADRARRLAAMTAVIKVSGTIHAGTRLELYGRQVPVREDLRGAAIIFDPESGDVVVR